MLSREIRRDGKVVRMCSADELLGLCVAHVDRSPTGQLQRKMGARMHTHVTSQTQLNVRPFQRRWQMPWRLGCGQALGGWK